MYITFISFAFWSEVLKLGIPSLKPPSIRDFCVCEVGELHEY